MQVNIERLRQIANDKRSARAPYVGIPLVERNGERMCITVKRDHLKAAVALAVYAKWDGEAARLVLNGGRSEWKLVNLIAVNRYAVNGFLEQWARAQRKSIVRKSASPAERKAAGIDKEIGVLRRKLAKVHARRVNPLCVLPRCESDGTYNYHRGFTESEAAWAQGKRVRRELSRVFTGPALETLNMIHRPDWESLYAAAAKVLGVESIDESKRHSRVTKLTRGPSITDYVRHPEIHLARMSKPYRTRTCAWDTVAARQKDGECEPDSVKTFVEQMREARMRYLEELSGRHALEAQIVNLEEVKRVILEAGVGAEVQP